MTLRWCVSIAILGTLLAGCLAACPASSTVSFSLGADKELPWQHVWERCVGSGHALLALREDYRIHLRRVREELGFEYIRFHGILDDDLSVYLDGGSYYSFFNTDSIFDFLLSIGMRPIVELSFMPADLASCNNTIFHYKGGICPPKDYAKWGDLITHFVQHLEDRYGADEVRQWFFEVWNEPNCGFWTGGQAEYFKLYANTAKAVKSVDAQLRVGGPATCQSAWLAEFMSYCKSNNVPYDFISTHEYPTDVTPVQRDTLKEVFTKARATVGQNTSLFYTEYNSGLNPPQHDDPYAAAFVIHNVLSTYGLVDLLSYWTFSDIFEEGGFVSWAFQEGYGMLTIHNIAKPVYRAFQLLHQTGDRRLSVVANINSTVNVLATYNTTDKARGLNVIIYNHNVLNATIRAETVCVTIRGVTPNGKAVSMVRIDSTHANPKANWVKMGPPQYPSKDQLAELQLASQLVPQDLPYTTNADGTVQFEVVVPPEGVVSVTFPGLNV